MRILYISALPQTMSGGPKYSVPNQVNHQAAYDDVCWINVTKWGIEDSPVPCECLTDADSQKNRIEEFRPELIVFEDLYYIDFCRLGRYARGKRIPYIVIPRGCLTRAAQKQKWYKKIPANILLFIPFARHAAAVEFLTEKERETSAAYWNKKRIIIPNGTAFPAKTAAPAADGDCFRGTFIGRINPYHKGLDVFFEVCRQLKDVLLKKNCRMDFYGPYPAEVGEAVMNDITTRGLESLISIHKEIHGQEKENVLLNSDFFILTSRFEGLPMGLLEALSYGLPALVTHETNIGEMIAAAGAGFSSPCTVEGIRESFAKLLDMPREDLAQMSENAVVFARRFDWHEIARDSHEKYMMLLKEVNGDRG